MAAADRTVKGHRGYDSTRRREQAALRHAKIIDAAEQRFLVDGYAKTTVAAVAEQAEVSVDTIHKTFGGKAGLVQAIYQRALHGVGPIPAEQRSELLQAQEADPRKIIEGWGRFVTEIAPRGTPVVTLIRAASGTDPELRSLLRQIDDERLERMTQNAERLHRAGHLRPGLTIPAAADILWTYSSPELYELLVLRRHMKIEDYGKFVSEAMTAALLP